MSIKFEILNSTAWTSIVPGCYRLDEPTESLIYKFSSCAGGAYRFSRHIYWPALIFSSCDLAKKYLLKNWLISDSEKVSILLEGKCIVPSYDKKDRETLSVAKTIGSLG